MENHTMEIDVLGDGDDSMLSICFDQEVYKEKLVGARKEVNKAQTRNRKKRIKTLGHVVHSVLQDAMPVAFSDEILQTKTDFLNIVMQFVDEFRDLFIDTLKLLLSVLDEGGHWDNSSSTSLIELEESYATYLEFFVRTCRAYCDVKAEESDRPEQLVDFLRVTSDLSAGLVLVILDNESWRFEFLSIPLSAIFNQWNVINEGFPTECAMIIQNWCSRITPVITRVDVNSKIATCGDFSCQYFLSIILQQWLAWMDQNESAAFVNEHFGDLDAQIRNEMGRELDKVVRKILNILNGDGDRTGVHSIRCINIFAGNVQLGPPLDQDAIFADFSIYSRRLHVLVSTSEHNPWANLNIRFEHIDSICVTWEHLNDNNSAQFTQAQSQSQLLTQFSNMDVDSKLLLHIKLAMPIDSVCNDLHEFAEQGVDSLTLVFQDVDAGRVERVLQKMKYPTHSACPRAALPGSTSAVAEAITETHSEDESSPKPIPPTPIKTKIPKRVTTPFVKKTPKRVTTPFIKKTPKRVTTPFVKKTSKRVTTPFVRVQEDETETTEVTGSQFDTSSISQLSNIQKADECHHLILSPEAEMSSCKGMKNTSTPLPLPRSGKHSERKVSTPFAACSVTKPVVRVGDTPGAIYIENSDVDDLSDTTTVENLAIGSSSAVAEVITEHHSDEELSQPMPPTPIKNKIPKRVTTPFARKAAKRVTTPIVKKTAKRVTTPFIRVQEKEDDETTEVQDSQFDTSPIPLLSNTQPDNEIFSPEAEVSASRGMKNISASTPLPRSGRNSARKVSTPYAAGNVATPDFRVKETPGAFYVEDSDDDLNDTTVDSPLIGRRSIFNMTAESAMEDPLPRSLRETVKTVLRIQDRNTRQTRNSSRVPVYQSLRTDPSFLFPAGEDDPYDIENDPIFKAEMATKKYSAVKAKRKRRNRVAANAKIPKQVTTNFSKKTAAAAEVITDHHSDEELSHPIPPTPIKNKRPTVKRVTTPFAKKTAKRETTPPVKKAEKRVTTPLVKKTAKKVTTPLLKKTAKRETTPPKKTAKRVQEEEDETTEVQDSQFHTSPIPIPPLSRSQPDNEMFSPESEVSKCSILRNESIVSPDLFASPPDSDVGPAEDTRNETWDWKKLDLSLGPFKGTVAVPSEDEDMCSESGKDDNDFEDTLDWNNLDLDL